jgi:hypothetical protein
MSWFNKLQNGAQKLFTKTVNDPNIFRKIGNTARKVDNSIARVGHFLSNTANTMGMTPLAGMINSGVNAAHQIRNNLEKSIHAPLSDIKKYA